MSTQTDALALLLGQSFAWDTDTLARTVAAAIGGLPGGITFAAQSEAASIVVDTAIAASAGNVYKTLAEAAVERRKLNGPCDVEFRQSTAHPAQAYDFRDASGAWNTTFVGPALFSQTFPAGSTLAGVINFGGQTIFNGLGGSVFVTAPSGFVVFQTLLGSSVNAPAGGDFFNASNVVAAASVWILNAGGGIFSATQKLLGSRGANASTTIVALDQSIVATSTLFESAAGICFVQQSPAGIVSRTQANLAVTGPNLTPGGNLALIAQAKDVAVTDTAPVYLTAPTAQLQPMVDAIKARLSGPPLALTDANQGVIIDAALTGGGRFRTVAARSANRTYTLNSTNAVTGDCMDIVVVDKAAFTVTFIDGVSGGTLFVIPVLSQGSARFQWNGANWILRQLGTSL